MCRGSGQIIDQGARLVDIALDNGQAFSGDGWKYISDSFESNTVHFIGLLSDGGVHSRYNQLAQFIKGAAERGAKKIRIHILTVSTFSCSPVAFGLASFNILFIIRTIFDEFYWLLFWWQIISMNIIACINILVVVTSIFDKNSWLASWSEAEASAWMPDLEYNSHSICKVCFGSCKNSSRSASWPILLCTTLYWDLVVDILMFCNEKSIVQMNDSEPHKISKQLVDSIFYLLLHQGAFIEDSDWRKRTLKKNVRQYSLKPKQELFILEVWLLRMHFLVWRAEICDIQDGRDVPDGTSVKFVEQLEKDLSDLSKSGCDAKIGSGGGRMGVTMDRYEADWSIVEKGWNAHVLGEAPNKFKDAKTAVVELRVRCFTIRTVHSYLTV